jgi:hypothetical protein
MSNITIIDSNASYSLSIKKPEKTGSLSMFIAFGDKSSRLSVAQEVLLKQYQSGTYRPVVRDLVQVLVSAKSIGFFPELQESGSLSKADFVAVCKRIHSSLPTGKDFKGQKAFYVELLLKIVNNAKSNEMVIEA